MDTDSWGDGPDCLVAIGLVPIVSDMDALLGGE
jgi:hypothetical protein